MLAAPGQAHPNGRDGLDHLTHLVAAQQRRGGQGVRQTEIGHTARAHVRQPIGGKPAVSTKHRQLTEPIYGGRTD